MSDTTHQLKLELKKRLPRPLQNVLSNWMGSLAAILIAFFLSPFVVHHLGTAAYGVWVLIMSLTGSLGLLDLGVRGTVTCYVARFHSQGKHEEASRLVSSALVIFTLLGTVALGISVVIAFMSPRLFHVPETSKASLQTLCIFAGATVACTLISNVFGAIIVGLQRFKVMNAVEISAAILKAFVILIALVNGEGLVSLAIIQLAICAATGLASAWISWRIYPQLTVRYILSDQANMRLIVSFGSRLFLLNVSSYLIFYTDSIVISAFLPVTMVAFFAIAGNLVGYSRALVSGMSFTVTPLVSALDAAGNSAKVAQIGLAGPRYATMVVLPIVITFALRGKTFIGLWMGSEYADLSSRVLQVLSLVLFFSAANQIATVTMLGTNNHRPLVYVVIAEALSNLALSIVLVQQIGVVGVAWGTALPNLATGLIFWPLYMRRLFKIRPSQYILSTWGRPAIAAVPFALISFIIDRAWYAPTVWFFFFQIALSLPAAAIAFWFGCLSEAERRSCMKRIFSSPARVGEAASTV